MKKEKIKTVDGQTLLDMHLPQIRFVVENLLPQGLHILAGAAKTGKSWLLLLLSLRVAQGKPFWNLQTEKGTVLSLCLEDSLNRIQQRLMDLTEEASANLHFATLSNSLSAVSYTHLVLTARSKALTMPVVTDCPYPRAFPMATTCSPTINSSESPTETTEI